MNVERINLLPHSLLVSRAVRARVRLWALTAALVLAATAGGTAVYALSTVEPSGTWERSLAEERDRADELRTVIAGHSALVGSLSRELQMRLRITACPDWSPLLRAVAVRVGPRAELAGLGLQPSSEARDGASGAAPTAYSLMLTGVTDSAQSLSEMLLDLERLDVLDRVELIASRAVEADGGARRIAFDVNCTLSDRALASVSVPDEREDGR